MRGRVTSVLESEAGFRVLFECATIGIIVVNGEGVIELSNPCVERLFGYRSGELIGAAIEVLMPESVRRRHIRHREVYFNQPKSRPMGLGMELYARKRNGDVFPVEISLGHYKLSGVRLAVAFVTDLTDQVKAKKVVAEREAWFRSMADHSPVMIWVSGPDKQCTYFNKTWLNFTGRVMEQELGTGWMEVVHPDDREQVAEAYRLGYELVQPVFAQYRLRRNDGQYRWVECAGKPTFSDHVFTGFVMSCSDIHDQRMKKAELEHLVRHRTNELHEALEREKQMNELKSRFVSMASHEFRTPLSIILSSATLIDQCGVAERDERVEKHLKKIKSSIANLTNILNDFLSLDTLEGGMVNLEPESFVIREFLNDVIAETDILRKPGQTINLRHEGDNLIVLDQKKLRYILVNLISNSVKYSPADGQIDVISRNNAKSFVILVRDHGIGIPEEEQQYLYTKFFRASNTGSIQGTGLGLTIVKRYVELMKGKISCTSQRGEGTTFTIELPKV